MLEVEYELCEACEKAMEEAGVAGFTAEEMMDQDVTFGFDLALALLEEGYDVIRSGKEGAHPIRLVFDDNEYSCSFGKAQFASIIDDKVSAYLTLPTEDILADDWKIFKLVE